MKHCASERRGSGNSYVKRLFGVSSAKEGETARQPDVSGIAQAIKSTRQPCGSTNKIYSADSYGNVYQIAGVGAAWRERSGVA